MPLAAGVRLGSYQVLSPLGAGGMGEVYRARHLKLGRDVAIKVLPSELASDPERRQRFEREARAASALNHPNIVTIHDIDEQDGNHYIAMELVEGHTLRELLGAAPLPLGRLLALARQIAEGLAKAHAAGIMHRDLKPENIMVTGDGLVKILDFGLAKLAPEPASADSQLTTAEQATRVGVVLGTVPYMSPEQAAGRPVDFRSDQFSFGSILYEMATGRRAFKKDTTPQTLAAIIEGRPEPLGRLNPTLPAPFTAVVERCLAKDPERRFESTRGLAAAVHAVPETPRASRTRRRAVWALACVAAGGLAWALLPTDGRLWRTSTPGSATPLVRAVAVLPLRNLSGDQAQEYFADGLTEALITDLAKIGSLKVISRSSAMRFKGTRAPLADVARQLGVDAVVEGSAQRVGDRVRIMAQLIDPKTERALWAESYEHGMSDVLRLQGEVAQAIALKIGAAVTAEEKQRLTARRSVSPAALEAYFRGVYHLQRFTPQDLEASLRHFQAALEIDPEYASAHAGIAQVWGARMLAGFVAPREGAPPRLVALRKALDLDSTLPEAHVALAQLRTWYEWDWPGAEAAFQRAIELNPSNAQARIFYSHLLTVLGRTEEGGEQARRALELDPLNPMYQALAGVQLLMARRLDEGIARIRSTLAKTPGFGFGYVPLWIALEERERFDEALTALKSHHAARGETDVVAALDRGNAAGGYREALLRAAETLDASSRATSAGAIHIANLYARAGRTEEALEWLERAYATRDPNTPYLGEMGFSEDVRRSVRFQDLLRRMKLPDRRGAPS